MSCSRDIVNIIEFQMEFQRTENSVLISTLLIAAIAVLVLLAIQYPYQRFGLLEVMQPGQTLDLTLLREGVLIQISSTLAKRPTD